MQSPSTVNQEITMTQTNEHHELAGELFDIQEEMLELLNRAKVLLRRAPNMIYQRADAYWLAHARMAITKEHGYLGGSLVTMDDTIAEVIAASKEPDVATHP
jgi:hypothetical protein